MKEQELYNTWKQTQSPDDLMAIVKALDPIIRKEVNKWSMGLAPRPALEIKAKQLTVEAIKSYDPGAATKLSSWVVFYLKKLNRFTNSYSLFPVPEDKGLEYNHYLKTKNNLTEDYGMPPTVDALADAMHWSPKKVVSMERSFSPTYNDSTLNTANYLAVTHVTESDLHYAYDNLTQYEKQLFTMKTGWPSGKPLGVVVIGKKMGKSTGTVSTELKALAERINQLLKR
jgi:DNA-directed RNA polymerase sigma subunit (sigma70/sigma32)